MECHRPSTPGGTGIELTDLHFRRTRTDQRCKSDDCSGTVHGQNSSLAGGIDRDAIRLLQHDNELRRNGALPVEPVGPHLARLRDTGCRSPLHRKWQGGGLLRGRSARGHQCFRGGGDLGPQPIRLCAQTTVLLECGDVRRGLCRRQMVEGRLPARATGPSALPLSAVIEISFVHCRTCLSRRGSRTWFLSQQRKRPGFDLLVEEGDVPAAPLVCVQIGDRLKSGADPPGSCKSLYRRAGKFASAQMPMSVSLPCHARSSLSDGVISFPTSLRSSTNRSTSIISSCATLMA